MAVKIFRQQDGFHEGGDVVIRVTQQLAQSLLKGRRQVFTHEVAVELARQILGGDGLRQQNVNHLLAGEASGAAQNGFLTIVVLLGVDDKAQVFVIPAGESPGGFLDVLFCVIAHPHGEQLHDFTRKVFVRCAFEVHTRIQKRQHRRVFGNRHHQVTKFARGVLAQQFILNMQLAVVAYFLFGGGKVAVPKQRHFFLEGTRRGEHAVGPPIAQAVGFQTRHPEPIQIAVSHLLHTAVATRLDFHAQGFARGLGQIGGCRSRGGKGL